MAFGGQMQVCGWGDVCGGGGDTFGGYPLYLFGGTPRYPPIPSLLWGTLGGYPLPLLEGTPKFRGEMGGTPKGGGGKGGYVWGIDICGDRGHLVL